MLVEHTHNLSSGKMFKGDNDDLLNIQQQGKETARTLFEERGSSFRVPFHDAIHKVKPFLFGEELFKTQQ